MMKFKIAASAVALICSATCPGILVAQPADGFEVQADAAWRQAAQAKEALANFGRSVLVKEPPNVPPEVLDAESGVVILWIQYEKPDGTLGTKGYGSGFVLDSQRGYIVTNAHVARMAVQHDTIFAEFKNGRKPEAKLVGMDEARDIAVLKVDPAAGIPRALKLGNSDPEALKVADRVFSWGMPMRQKFTLGIGWVNSRIRTAPYIRVTTPINPGSSGGPLLNDKGEVVGINSAILSDHFIGHAFAIPIGNVKKYIDQIVQTGKTTRGFLGIQADYWEAKHPQAIDGSFPGAYGYVRILAVSPGSPADGAGLQVSDSILAINGEPIKDDILGLIQAVADSDAEHGVSLEVWNGKAAKQGKPIRLQIPLQDANGARFIGLKDYF